MFPQFLNFTTAAIAAAVAVPLLLILYFLKLRRQPAYVSSTLLWKKAVQDLQVNSPFQRLRRNLLLLLQLLLLFLLLFALSRPVSNVRATAGDKSVILIDRSASMNANDGETGSRLDDAKDQALALVDTMGRGDVAMVIAFDDTAEILQPFTADAGALRAAIRGIEPTDRFTNLEPAYKLADAQMAFDPDNLRSDLTPIDVFLYSDGNAGDGQELSLQGNLRYTALGKDDSPNLGIVALDARRNFDRPTEVQVFARLANFGPEKSTANVRMSVSTLNSENPAEDNWQTRDIDGNLYVYPASLDGEALQAAIDEEGTPQRDAVEFTLDLTTAATIRLELINNDGDVLSADDQAYVFVPPPRPLNVLVVTDGNYFLEKALAALNIEEPTYIGLAEYAPDGVLDYDVIFFDRFSPQALPASGNFVFLGGTPPEGSELIQATNENGERLFAQEQLVLDWDRDNPMLAGLNMGKLYAAETPMWSVPLDATVLLEGIKGPMLVLHRQGGRTTLVGFDVYESNWPTNVTFPVFLHNAIKFLAVGSDLAVRQSIPPGTNPRLPRSNIDRAGNPDRITVNGPDGDLDKDVPEAGDLVLDPLENVGLYTLEPAVPQFERLAVNLLSASESAIAPSELPPGGVGATVEGGSRLSRLEWWWWLTAAAGLFLIVEWWVYTRKVAA
ncbi:MAG: VWA domain-containing protein [Planctomycetota bacterium]